MGYYSLLLWYQVLIVKQHADKHSFNLHPLAMLRIGTIYYSKNCQAYLPVTPTLQSRRFMAWEIDGLVCQTQVIVANCTTEDYTCPYDHICQKYFLHLSNQTLYRDLVCFVKRQSFSFSPKWPLTTIRWYFTGLLMTGLKPFLLYSKEN